MPRLNSGQLPVIRHQKPSGWAVVTLGGKDYYLGRFGSKAAEREYARFTAKGQRGTVSRDDDRPADLTLVELLAAFKRHAKTYYGPTPASMRPTARWRSK